MKFIITGANDRTLALPDREALSIPQDRHQSVLKDLLLVSGVKEGVLLSTCNRTEIHAAVENEDIAEALRLKLCDSLGIIEPKSQGWYTYTDEDAIRHLFRVASSLDSMVLGEAQILGQLKEAYKVAFAAECTGNVLNQLYHRAFSAAKCVRSLTGIGVGSTSLSSIAIDLIETSVCFRTPPTLLVIGAGEMGVRAAETYFERRLGNIIIVNRTAEKADALANACQATSLPWEKLDQAILLSDVIVVCTGSLEPVLHPGLIESRMQHVERKALTIIDLSVPRGVDPEVASLSGVTLHSVDDLRFIAEKNRATRAKEATQAENIVTCEATRAAEALTALPLSPVIEDLTKKCEAIRLQELSKVFRRLKGLSPEERLLIEKCTSSLVSKILHDPIAMLKEYYSKEKTLKS
ncbi:MAG: glutamyl-tRNA reductase [Deltaproteobacteria bacterium]|nr:glutamyl-tRNA reductase [Deltaproteobacteria bacterium]